MSRSESADSERRGFDFSAAMRGFMAQLVADLPPLAHIELSRCVVAISQARNRSQYGTFASCTPLRFEGGTLTGKRRGRQYTMQRVLDGAGVDQLYIVTFFLPRFMDLPLAEKVETAIHELWHIGPNFDGDLRRYPGRYYAHGRTGENHLDTEVKELTRQWEIIIGYDVVPEFLRLSFDELSHSLGPVYGYRVRRPKLLPLPAAAT